MAYEMQAVTQQPTGNQNLVVGPGGNRDWNSGLFSCTGDCGNCMCTICCFPCMVCKLATRMDECCMMPFLAYGSLVAMRTKVRTMGDIRGSICNDYMASHVCAPCVICQLAREMDTMGL